MKKVLYSLFACILSLSFLTPFNIYANELYPHEDYENVFYDDDENYFDEYGNKLEGPWELMYMDYIPGDLAIVPDEPGTGGVSASTQYYELWNANMVPVATMTFTGNAKLIDSNGYYYQYLYMYCDTGYSTGDKVSYDYTFEFYAGTNPLDFVSSVSVCGNSATYSISGTTLNVTGVTNTIDDDGQFYVIITFSKKLNGTFMVGPNSKATFSDYKEVDENEEQQMAQLGEILGILQNIDANIEYGVLDIIANINGNLMSLSSNINSHFNSLNGWLINQTNEIKTAIQTQTINLMNTLLNIQDEITLQFGNLDNWIKTQTQGITNKLEDLLGSKNDYDDNKEDLSDSNNELSNNVNDYNDLENSLHQGMNDSLNQIDLNVNLINGSDFITTATFISTNMNRIVNSNPYFNAFVITGLVLGIALVMIGKKVI